MNDSVYVRTANTAHMETRELVPGQVFADFGSSGELIGVEVLGAIGCVSAEHRRHETSRDQLGGN